MKKLRQFVSFDCKAFFVEKKLQLVGISDWIDYDTKKKLGVKADVAIVVDRTQYDTKPGEIVSNKFEKFAVKVKRGHLDIEPDSIVSLVNPIGKVYGDFSNQLAVTCDDIQVVAVPKKA